MATIKNRKVVITEFGDVSKLAILTDNLPPPPKNHVQVNIIYSGFAGADVNMRLGLYPFQRSAPLTPGYCFSGRVAVNGPGCSKFAPGTLVVAMTKYDSEAEHINIPEKYLIPIPEGVSSQQAAALCLDWTTAYGCVYRHAQVKRGQRVFIHGLSGAVGQGLMHLSLLQGASVYGTASERNHAALTAAGAHPYVYTNKNWIRAMQDLGGVHAVFDPLGFESFDESYSILTCSERSVLVAYGNNLNSLSEGESPRSTVLPMLKVASWNLALWSKKSTSLFMITRDQSTFEPELKKLLNMVKEGTISPPIKQVWDMDDIRAAHEAWGKGQGMGSLLIRVSQEETQK